MLLFMIIWLWWIPFFMRILPSDEDLAPSLLLKLLLIDTFRTYQQANIVDSLNVWQVNLAPMLEHLWVS